jgi:hypothetical protein
MLISFNNNINGFICTCDLLVSWTVHYITAARVSRQNSSDKEIISKLADAQNKIFFSSLEPSPQRIQK